MRSISFKVFILLLYSIPIFITTKAQDTSFNAKHAAIYFPYPMYHEKWRSSIGFTLMTTPEDITEEVRIRVPCGDYTVLRRVNNQFIANGRIMFQILQNHLSAGISFVKPLNKHFYVSVGNDIGFWFGFLKVGGFNSKASGWLDYPNFSIGYKTNKNLLFSFKTQLSYNLYYQSKNGDNKFSSSKNFYNGEMFTFAIEQPFYNKKHITLAFSVINNYFYWQTWSLFYKTDRKIYYPQLAVGFIL